DSPDQIIRSVERDYEKEYGPGLIIHQEKENYKGLEIFRLTGWTEEEERNYTEINSVEWIVIFCTNQEYQIIKHTAFMPMDSIAKMYDIRCNLEGNED